MHLKSYETCIERRSREIPVGIGLCGYAPIEVQASVRALCDKSDKGPVEGEVFLATGLTPNSEILEGIADIGRGKEVKVNKRMETSHKNIYAAGDVVGGIANTPVARMEE